MQPISQTMKKGILSLGLLAAAFVLPSDVEAISFTTHFEQDKFYYRLQIMPQELTPDVTSIHYAFNDAQLLLGQTFLSPVDQWNIGFNVTILAFGTPGLHTPKATITFADNTKQVFDVPSYTVADWTYVLDGDNGAIPAEVPFNILDSYTSVPDAGSTAALLLLGLGGLHLLRRTNRSVAHQSSGC